jgi:hypothetical protein
MRDMETEDLLNLVIVNHPQKPTLKQSILEDIRRSKRLLSLGILAINTFSDFNLTEYKGPPIHTTIEIENTPVKIHISPKGIAIYQYQLGDPQEQE